MPLPTDLPISFTPRPAGDFPSTYANEAAGGYHTVETNADRDAIPDTRRVQGMSCYVWGGDTPGKAFRLKPGPWAHNATDWNEQTTGGGGGGLSILVWDDGEPTAGNSYGSWAEVKVAARALGGACILDVIDKGTTLVIDGDALDCRGMTIFRTASKDPTRPLLIQIDPATNIISPSLFDGAFRFMAVTQDVPVMTFEKDVAFTNGAFFLAQAGSTVPLATLGYTTRIQFDLDAGALSEQQGLGVFRLLYGCANTLVITRALTVQPHNTWFMGGDGGTLNYFYDMSVTYQGFSQSNASPTIRQLFTMNVFGSLAGSLPSPTVLQLDGNGYFALLGNGANPFNVIEQLATISGLYTPYVSNNRIQLETISPSATEVHDDMYFDGNVSGASIYDIRATVLAISQFDSGVDVKRWELSRSCNAVGGDPPSWLGPTVVTNVQGTVGASSWTADIDFYPSNPAAMGVSVTGEGGRPIGWMLVIQRVRFSAYY